jgi:hypothetical protein
VVTRTRPSAKEHKAAHARVCMVRAQVEHGCWAEMDGGAGGEHGGRGCGGYRSKGCVRTSVKARVHSRGLCLARQRLGKGRRARDARQRVPDGQVLVIAFAPSTTSFAKFVLSADFSRQTDSVCSYMQLEALFLLVGWLLMGRCVLGRRAQLETLWDPALEIVSPQGCVHRYEREHVEQELWVRKHAAQRQCIPCMRRSAHTMARTESAQLGLWV